MSSKPWDCVACTFKNNPSDPRCRMCGMAKAKKQPVCVYYGTPGGCRYGAHCRNKHVDVACPGDFDDKDQYTEWIRKRIKPGDKVRMLEGYKLVKPGDIGTFVQSNQLTPPAQFYWQDLGRAYWVWWHDVQLLKKTEGTSSPARSPTRASSRPKVSPQIQMSRDRSIDGTTSWPPEEVLRMVPENPTASPLTNAIEFVRVHEVEFRRIAELTSIHLCAHGLRFCDGGMDAEKTKARAAKLSLWETQNWHLTDPIEKLWAGERDFDTLTSSSDDGDKIVMRAIFLLVVKMEAKLGTDPEKFPWSQGYPRPINVYYPMDGSYVEQGDTLTINWLTKPGCHIKFVKIRLWKKSSNDNSRLKYELTIAKTIRNTHEYKWKVPYQVEPGTFFKVTVGDADKPDLEDQSGPFAITQGTPDGGLPDLDNLLLSPTAPQNIATQIGDNTQLLNPMQQQVPPQQQQQQQQQQQLDDEDDGLCIICMENEVDATFVHGDSGHMVACMTCAKQVMQKDKTCPMCRSKCDTVIRSFTR